LGYFYFSVLYFKSHIHYFFPPSNISIKIICIAVTLCWVHRHTNEIPKICMTAKEYNSCVDSFADGLYRFALKTLGDADGANDVVQDCFERLWVKRENVDFAKVKSYLFTSAYHACIDIIRMNKRSGAMDEASEISLSTTAQYSDLQEVLHEALKKLPEVQRSVILLRDYEGYSYEEIGGITGLNESQVKVYIYRARIALKQYIGQLETVI